MINILKPFAGWATALRQNKFRLAALKLTFFYVLSTAAILLVSSVAVLILFQPVANQFPFDDESIETEVEDSDWSLHEVREHLVAVITLVDLSVLLFVSVLSYYFAQNTLRPIKEVYEEQQRFMADVTHELRTPLSVLLAGADTVLRKPRSVPDYQEFIVDVKEEAGRLTRLSNQLLQLLRTGSVGKAIYAEVDVSRVLKTETRRFVAYGEERGVVIVDNIEPAIIIYTDEDRLVEVLQNLLKNAIDYNKKDGSVLVSLSENKTAIALVVKDTGVGMSPETQAVIFNRFTKGDAARTQKSGSGAGLGLAIVEALTISLGGQVVLESTLDIGTTITVTLPKTHS